jgi:hypothetical protein
LYQEWRAEGYITRTATSSSLDIASPSPAIHIGPVVDRDDLDESPAFVNSVDHPIGAASRTPEAFELETKRFSHPLRRIRDMVNRL